MDITKLLPLILAAKSGSGNQSNLNQILPEIIKAQSGDQNALTSMLLNMLSNNFNKQNATCQNSQTEQANMQQSEFKPQNSAVDAQNYSVMKNYKNFYAPPEYSNARVTSANAEQNAKIKNSADDSAINVDTPFGYTRLYWFISINNLTKKAFSMLCKLNFVTRSNLSNL